MFFKKKEEKPKITFRHREDLATAFPAPKVASKFMPEWFKKLPRVPEGAGVRDAGTIKRCVPVLDAVTNGYIIPVWADMVVKITKEMNEENEEFVRVYVRFPGEFGMGDMVSSHSWEQVGEACPISKFKFGKILMKFTNPWVVETSPGYSCMFKSPPHQYTDIHILEGVVDTDTYKRQVNFPFIWTGSEEGEFFFPKGTPLVHVVPFKRVEMESEVANWDHKTMTEIDRKHETHFFDKYKKLWWHKRKKD
jgi:hypothetical protein